MALDSTQIRLAPSGHVYIAPYPTVPLPTDVTTTLAVAWKELGYLSEDGVAIAPTYDTNGIKAWQSAVNVKTTVSGVGLTAKINMLQVTKDATAEFFFGSSWVAGGPVGRLNVSSNPSLAERSMVVEWTDDLGYINRFVMGRGFLTDRDSMQLQRTEATAFGITFECLDNAGLTAYWLSNSPTLAS